MLYSMKKQSIFAKNKYTILSIAIICGMFAIVQSFYDPDVNLTKPLLNEKAIQEGKGESKIGGEFTMRTIGSPSRNFTEQNLLGNYSLIFFGYTFCPDICPTTLSTLAEVYNALSPEHQSKVNVIMVTVDAARDKSGILKEYVTAFHPDFTAIRGSDDQTKDMANKYLAYYAKSGKGKDYAMDHSSYTYLMGPDGKYIHHFRHSDTAKDILKTMNELLQK